MCITQTTNDTQAVVDVQRALTKYRIGIGLLVKPAVDQTKIGTSAQVENIEALKLVQSIVGVIIIDTGDKFERPAGWRQNAKLLRELVEPFGEAVVNRIVGGGSVDRNRLIKPVNNLGVEP